MGHGEEEGTEEFEACVALIVGGRRQRQVSGACGSEGLKNGSRVESFRVVRKQEQER